MPTLTYEKLLLDVRPQRIETEDQFASINDRLGTLVGKGKARSRDETKLMDLLVLLVEDYDRRHGMPPAQSTPLEVLHFLMEQSGRPNSDLLPVFGQRSHVHEALSGKRPISAEHARRLGKLFGLEPGLFIGR